MSDQEFNDSFDEQCENCHDPLNGERNWNVEDVKANLLYCTKVECQAAKPVLIKNQTTGKSGRKQRPRDAGLSHEIKERSISKFVNIIPDPIRVADFSEKIADPSMLNAKGYPKYSVIFREFKIFDPLDGPTVYEMAAAQFPGEVDTNGCPSKAAVRRIKNYLRALTIRYDGNLEIYATPVENPITSKRESRYHINKNPDDLKKQVDRMEDIASHIQLAARKRERNFAQRTFEQRMEKVEHLDKFFE